MRTLLRPVVAVAVVLLLAAPADAATTLLSKKDAKGDVTLYRSSFITAAQKKSIDIEKASVKVLGNGKYRFTVRIKKIHTTRKWDQIALFHAGPSGGDPQQVAVTFKVRGSSGAYAYDSVSTEGCPLKVRRKGREAWVDVPRRCAPQSGQNVVLDTYAGHYQTDAPPYSHDRLRMGRL